MKDDSIGNYQLGAKLGEGGMGAVYRARDTRLNRDVAIKLLPSELAADSERLERFEREARVLASLNHPNIASIYGVEDYKEQLALVMELVEGESLQARIVRGPLSLEEILDIGAQIAEGVEAAHEKGIIHRDLKPANVQLTAEGRVKVLDFGLAKAADERDSDSDLASSPTMTAATAAGVILGTAAYMSPEQARGGMVDRRTDIWSFGVILYELLTGNPAFSGDTLPDLLVAVLSSSPDLDSLPVNTPPVLRDLIERCLRKDPRQRLRDLGDARILLQELREGKLAGEPEQAPATSRPSTPGTLARTAGLAWLLAALSLIALATVLWSPRQTHQPAPPVRFALPTAGWDIPVNGRDSVLLDISRDGRQLVFTSQVSGSPKLFLRRFDELGDVELTGTEGGYSPFFSPDGRWVGFFQRGRLMKISTSEEVMFDLGVAGWSRGAAWTDDGKIVFSPNYQSPIMEISDDGTLVRAITTIDEQRQERTHRWPTLLPGGEIVLFTVGFQGSPGQYEDSELVAVSRRTGERKVILERAAMARYIRTGHLAFLRSSSVWIVEFDASALKVVGTPRPLPELIGVDPSSGAAHFAVSDDGTLAYVPQAALAAEREFVLVSRDGTVDQLPLEPAEYQTGRFSPDGRRIAYQVGSGGGNNDRLFIYDLTNGFNSRFTFGTSDMNPLWTATGKHLFYNSIGGAGTDVLLRAADGSEQEELFESLTEVSLLNDVGPDDKELLMTALSPTVMLVRVKKGPDGTLTRERIGDEDGYQWGGSFSPDFKWIAYSSNETGRWEVYVEPSAGRGKWQISSDGGMGPIWAPDGQELYFIDDHTVYAVEVRAEPSFRSGPPRPLFSGDFRLEAPPFSTIDISPDGKTFLMTRSVQGKESTREIHITTGWADSIPTHAPLNPDR